MLVGKLFKIRSLGIHLIVVVFSHNKLSDSTFLLPKTFSHCQQPFIKSFNINFSPFTFFIVFKYLLYLAYLIILYFEKHAFIVFVFSINHKHLFQCFTYVNQIVKWQHLLNKIRQIYQTLLFYLNFFNLRLHYYNFFLHFCNLFYRNFKFEHVFHFF